MVATAPPQRPSYQTPPPSKARTAGWARFRGVNQTDSRVAIDDDELAWSENALTIGNGAIQILHGPAAPVVTGAAIATLTGVTLSGTPVLIAVNTDGSLDQIATDGTITPIAVAATVTTAARVAIWQSSPVLIIDPTKGYMKWDGATFTVIDAARVGGGLAVFEGRVWLFHGRTIEYTAPATFDDFSIANGGGSVILTDSAFPGPITALLSAIEQLWIFGEGAIEALSNVQATSSPPTVVTTFSITNIVTGLGTPFPASVIGYFRAVALMAPFGGYALSGVTPQKLSDKLDGLIQDLTLTPCPAAVAVIERLQCLVFLVRYNGYLAKAAAPPVQLLLCFTQGKWFFAVQGTALAWITTLIVNGISTAWGTDGTTVYQLFGAADTTAVTYRVVSKLYDFGDSTQDKVAMKLGFEYQAAGSVSPRVTVDSEYQSVSTDVIQGNAVTWINAAGGVVGWLNTTAGVVVFVGTGMILSMADVENSGRYLGWTVEGSDVPYRIQKINLQYIPSRQWKTP